MLMAEHSNEKRKVRLHLIQLTATNVAGRNTIVKRAIDLIWLLSVFADAAISIFARA